MTRVKIQCHYCGKMRAESELYTGLCDTCAKKLQAGVISPEDIDRRWELIRKLDHTPARAPPEAEQATLTTQPDPVPMFTDPIPTQPDPVPMFTDPIPTQPEPIPTQPEEPTPAPDDEIHYYCDVCGARLKRGAYRCPRCDVVNDWRGTDVETDPDIVICDTCGAITDGTRCHNCGGGYD